MSNILKACFEDMEPESKPTNPDQIMQVMRLLKKNCFDFIVAGGYARDKFYGKEPADCDICIFNFHPDDRAEQFLLKSLMESLSAITDVRMCEAYEDDDPRLGNVIKLDSWNIDIIFYAKAKTAWDVLKQFDCNMNQFYLPGSIPDYAGVKSTTGDLEYAALTLSYPLYYGNSHEPHALEYLASGDLTLTRIVKMGEKWQEYTGKKVTGGAAAIYEYARLQLNSELPF